MDKSKIVFFSGIAISVIGVLGFLILHFSHSEYPSDTDSRTSHYKHHKIYESHQDIIQGYLEKKRNRLEKGIKKFDYPNLYLEYHEGIRKRATEKKSGYGANYLNSEYESLLSNKKHNLRTDELVWKERGPVNTPGRTRSVVVLPNDIEGETWIAGSVGGGIWKTTDAGNTWDLKTADFPSMAITTLAYCQNSPNVVYAGTGEAIGGSVGILGSGVYKSIDGGDTWTHLSSTANDEEFTIINRIIVHPDDPDIALLCTSQGEWQSPFRSKIFKTIDGGASWYETYQSDRWVFQLVANPENFSTIYASYWDTGVLKSTDLGETWEVKDNGFKHLDGRLELAVAPADTSWIYASAEGTAFGAGADLYLSPDAGETWQLIDQQFNGGRVDFLGGQGQYDNVIAVNPYDRTRVYYGGVNLWKTEVTNDVTDEEIKLLDVEVKNGEESIWDFVNFGAEYFEGKLEAGENIELNDFNNVIVVTGDGISQKAYRFTVGKQGSGVPDNEYVYNDYVDVPFQVWDADNNVQLMVSFRDQQEDGVFNLFEENTADGDEENHAREYVFIHDVNYSDVEDENIAQNGGDNIGHTYRQMYFFWPVLRSGEFFNAEQLPEDTIFIDFEEASVKQRVGQMFNISDAYENFGGKNKAFSGDSDGFIFHPDHHELTIIPVDETTKTFQILNGSDGGVFISNVSSDPGFNDGDWTMVGTGFNTGQFYGADKKQGSEIFIGGMQDNGTWKSSNKEKASSQSKYLLQLTGDGFEVLWNNLDTDLIIGSSQFNNFSKTTNEGATWYSASNGIDGESPFISKLANSPSNPNTIFTVTSLGVYRSVDFGDNWELTPINNNWSLSSFLDIEVSKSDYNIVWAGSGMSDSQKLHVSVDGGITFNTTNNYDLVELGNLSGLETHPFEDSTAYVLFSFANGPKILRTTDLGETWEDISGFGTNDESINGFPDVAVYSLLVRPDDPNVLWAGTELGIVESTDNGQSWSYLDSDLGAVAVWQMKAVDDKIVVATHGRGIWTATLDQTVELTVVPQVIGAGTGIDGQLFAKIKLNSAYDSTLVFVNDFLVDKIPANAESQEGVFNINGLTIDSVYDVRLEAYKSGKKYPSNAVSALYFEVGEVLTRYENNFDDNSDEDFMGNGFSVKSEANFNNGAIHSLHPYEEGDGNPNDNLNYYYYLRNPIKVQSSVNTIRYNDVAIIETGETDSQFGDDDFYDYVIVEGSKDGIQWEPLADGYDADFNTDWRSVYDSDDSGTSSHFKEQEIGLTETFQPDDTIMIRFRLFSDPFSTGWGWAIDDLKIQIEEEITGIEERKDLSLSVYPNPSNTQSTIKIETENSFRANFKLIDLSGRVHWKMDGKLLQRGSNKYQLATQGYQPGMYFILVEWNGGELNQKLLIR